MPDEFTNAHRAEITSLAARYGSLPHIRIRFWAELGALLSYGADDSINVGARQAMSIASSRVRSRAELPVQAPTKYELVINLKTAKALGLDVPPRCSPAPTR